MKAPDHVLSMSEQYADSERFGKRAGSSESELAIRPRAKLLKMAAEKSEKDVDPVSEFLRFLIDEWQEQGKLMKDLAEQAGLAKSMPSQIKARTSDASFYSASRLARPLGFRDLPDLVDAAYTWWGGDRTKRPEKPTNHPPGMTAGSELAAVGAELGYSSTEVDTAAMVASMVRGNAPLSREKAAELLQRARMFINDGARSIAEANAKKSRR